MSMLDKLTFANVKGAVFEEAPIGSLTNYFMREVHRNFSLNGSMNIAQIHPRFALGPVDTSSEAIYATVKRVLATAFILPVLASISALYNGVAGAAKLGFAVVAQMKKEDAETVKAEFNASFQHLITAVADFAIALFSTVIAVAYGVIPADVELAYKKLYLLGEEALRPSHARHGDEDNKDDAATPALINQGANFLTEQLFPAEDHRNWFQKLLGR